MGKRDLSGEGVRELERGRACILMVNFWATNRKNRAPSIVSFFMTTTSLLNKAGWIVFGLLFRGVMIPEIHEIAQAFEISI